jgi:hypothetical protein
MRVGQDKLMTRLLYMLHRGFVEARLLAMAGKNQQLADLADTMEIVPSYLQSGNDEELEIIRFGLEKYRETYPSQVFDYLGCLSGEEPVPWVVTSSP